MPKTKQKSKLLQQPLSKFRNYLCLLVVLYTTNRIYNYTFIITSRNRTINLTRYVFLSVTCKLQNCTLIKIRRYTTIVTINIAVQQKLPSNLESIAVVNSFLFCHKEMDTSRTLIPSVFVKVTYFNSFAYTIFK